jgi:hypothetical protein
MRNLKDSTQRWLTLLFLVSSFVIWVSFGKPYSTQAKVRAWINNVATSVASAGVAAVTPSAAQSKDTQIGAEAMRQITALVEEKESRTPAQRKIDSQLVYALKFRRGDRIRSSVPSLQANVDVDTAGKTVVDITGAVDDSLVSKIIAAGGAVTHSYPRYNMLRAAVPLDQLETIAALPQVRFITGKQEGQVWQATESVGARPVRTSDAPDFAGRAERVRSQLNEALQKLGKQPTYNIGSKNSQGDTTHKADLARSTFGANGAGIRIGVLSNGVANLAASQALGDLGPVTVLPGQVGTGDEGTAMLEIIHDLAPGAQLYFATANPIIAAFAQNIRDLRAAGCDIIVDDVFYFVESPFQDGQTSAVSSNTNGGIVTQAVKDVTAAGALYFSSAGNQGNKNDNTSSCYQGDFVDGGALAGANGGTVHDFGGGAQSDLIQTGSGNPINLYWSDPLGGSSNDYDLYVFNNALTAVIASSTNVQNGTQDPFEQIAGAANVTNNRVVVLKKTGAANRFFHITINANGVGRLGTSTEGTTKGHSIALDAYSVGATPAAAPGPFPNPFSSANVTETFSSDGPRRIFFDGNGTPFTPGNFSSTGGTLRQKPDITAADRVSVTGVGGFPTTFSGTSAAAPHAGAIAALLKSAFPNLTNAQIRTTLIATAIDIEAPGVDRDSGAGIVMPFEAIQSKGGLASANLEAGTITAAELGGNANTFIEPGETGSLTVQLTNTGVAAATGISATLSTTTPGVTIGTATSAYPNLGVSASGTNTTPFTFSLAGNVACDLKINFKLTITYTGGNSPKTTVFTVQAGRPPITITSTIDATAPPASTDYTAVTGTQTNRVTRNGLASTASLPKTACPGITATATSPRFDAYTFTTCPGVDRVITVTLSTACPTVSGGTQLFATVYSGSFNPASICANFLADPGSSPGANGSVDFTFTVPANSTYVVVVSEVPGTATNCPYTLKVSGQCASCTAACTTPATPTVSANGPTTFCAGGGVTLTSSAATGNQWFLNGSPIAGATGKTFVATASGNYTVIATVNGCSSAPSAATAVTATPLPPTPTVTASGPTTFCVGGSVTLTSSAAAGNQWYLDGGPIPGATNKTYVATIAGKYTVVATSNGCGSAPSAATTVTINCTVTGPGLPLADAADVSDQKAGSALIYNLYTSSITSPNGQNARINLTNVHPTQVARAHLFFVDGSTCSVADSYVCLTANQTVSFLASDLDPGTTGYIVVVAVDSRGCPTNFNYLIGDEFVKFSTGHAANLPAESISALPGGLPVCDGNSSTAQLNFDGVSYNRIPRVLALDNIASGADGNDTLLVLNRIGGNLAGGASTLTGMFGVFYNDTETGVSFTFNPNVCQFRSSINTTFPRITPRFDQFVPAGRSGWVKLYSTNDQGILGSAINFNPNAASQGNAFVQGHNLHKLTLTSSATYTIPVFPPNC